MFDWKFDPFSLGHSRPARSQGAIRRPRPAGKDPASETLASMEVESGSSASHKEGEEPAKSVLKKAGWVAAGTKFKTEAEIFAEFDVPASEKKQGMVDFQVLRKDGEAFKPYGTAKGHMDASGRATAKVAIHKDRADTEIFRIQARHGAGAWSDGKDTDREVKESAEAAFEHEYVSGLHFPKDSSFIVPGYLKVFRDLEKAYAEWKKAHPNAKVVVFGHAEPDETDPPKLSARRAQIAFAFLIGDFHAWGRIAKEERWGVREQQHMLAALGFNPGKIDGIRGPKTTKSIRDFIAWLNAEEGKDINHDLGLTEEYIRLELYRVYITGHKRAVSMPSERFRTVSGYPYVGCRSFNRYKGGAGHHAENRRAGFLLVSENRNFPAPFPCQGNSGPCEVESAKAGERAIKGFRCKFYDSVMTKEAPDSIDESIDQEHSGELIWGRKVTLEFRTKVKKICAELGFDPNILMACMAFESGLSPSIQNRSTNATGLIQFMPSIAESLGTTVDELKKMSAETQLDYVYTYFKPYTGKIHSLEDAYMAILWPVAVGKPQEFVLFKKGTKAYEQNSGLDADEDGSVTKFEAAEKVRRKFSQGESCRA